MPWSPAAAVTRCPRQGPQPRVSRVNQLSMWVWQEGCRPGHPPPPAARKWRLYLVWKGEPALGKRGTTLPLSHLQYQQRGGRAWPFVKGNVLIPKDSHLPFFPIKALQIPGSALERLGALSCLKALREGAENTRRFFCLANPKTNPSAPALL